MAEEIITAKGTYQNKETKEEIPIEISAPYDFQDDHAAMVGEFGVDVVYHHAKSNMKVAFQAALRSAAAQGMETDSPKLQTFVENWPMPSGKPRGRSKMDKLKEMFGSLSDTDREALLADINQ